VSLRARGKKERERESWDETLEIEKGRDSENRMLEFIINRSAVFISDPVVITSCERESRCILRYEMSENDLRDFALLEKEIPTCLTDAAVSRM